MARGKDDYSILQVDPNKVSSQLNLCSMYSSAGIETDVEREGRKGVSGGDDVFCTACQLTVVWVQDQLRQAKTKECVLEYANKADNITSIQRRMICLALSIVQSLRLPQVLNKLVQVPRIPPLSSAGAATSEWFPSAAAAS